MSVHNLETKRAQQACMSLLTRIDASPARFAQTHVKQSPVIVLECLAAVTAAHTPLVHSTVRPGPLHVPLGPLASLLL
jgi:hypothetical protein